MRVLADFIFLVVFLCLVGVWLVAWAAFHLAGGAIHLLLVIAVVALILHFVRRARAV